MSARLQGNRPSRISEPSFLRRHRLGAGLVVVVVVCLAVATALYVVGRERGGGVGEADVDTSPPTWQPPACEGEGRTIVRPAEPGEVLSVQWEDPAPPDDVTYDLSGVTSTAYPASLSVFAVGVDSAALRTCVVGGTVLGAADDAESWNYYHDQYNAACVKIIALEWMQVRGLRCDNVEDGITPQESAVNVNNARFVVSGTYLSRIRDDCMENDYIVGGVLHDSLWESCNTGISERPSRDRSLATPASETLVLDRMLIGLYETPHVEGGRTVMGENALFKGRRRATAWSSSARSSRWTPSRSTARRTWRCRRERSWMTPRARTTRRPSSGWVAVTTRPGRRVCAWSTTVASGTTRSWPGRSRTACPDRPSPGSMRVPPAAAGRGPTPLGTPDHACDACDSCESCAHCDEKVTLSSCQHTGHHV